MAGEDWRGRFERHGRERLTMLADGVFAIALTLLALEIRPDVAHAGSAGALLAALAPKLVAYAVSALVISTFWLAQRRTFARFERVDGVIAATTLVFLALIALIPSATAMLYTEDIAVGMPIYLALIVLVSLTQAATWAYASLVARIVPPAFDLRARLVVLVVTVLTPPLMAGLSLYASAHRGAIAWAGWAALWGSAFVIRYASRRFVPS